MKRNFVSLLATLGLLACASAFASPFESIDLGTMAHRSSAQSQEMSFALELRDVRRAAAHQRVALVLRSTEANSVEQRMQDLKKALARGRALAPSRTGMTLTF